MDEVMITQDQLEAAYEELRREAVAIKAAKGILHGCAPLGYRNAVVNGEKVIVIDPETAPKVREMFRLSKERGMTIRKLVPLAAEMGLRSRNGKRLGPSSIHAILKNQFYKGRVRIKDRLTDGSQIALNSAPPYPEIYGSVVVGESSVRMQS